MNDIKFTCHSCNQVIEADLRLAGVSSACPTCNAVVWAPQVAGSSIPPIVAYNPLKRPIIYSTALVIFCGALQIYNSRMLRIQMEVERSAMTQQLAIERASMARELAEGKAALVQMQAQVMRSRQTVPPPRLAAESQRVTTSVQSDGDKIAAEIRRANQAQIRSAQLEAMKHRNFLRTGRTGSGF
jgi:hypothetical protein